MSFICANAAAQGQDNDCDGIFAKPVDFLQTSPSTATGQLEIFGLKPVDFNVAGDVETSLVPREAPAGGERTVQTEMLSMDLSGSHPSIGRIVIRQSSTRPSRGQMGQIVDGRDGCEALAARFDVFFDIEVTDVEGQTTNGSNNEPLVMIGEGPVPLIHTRPFQFVDAGQNPDGTPILDPTGRPIGVIRNLIHKVDPPPPCFKRGDANCDGCVDDADAEYINDFLFRNGPPPCCDDAADANDDGRISVEDAIYILAFKNQGGPPPPAPGPDRCGPDPTSDQLDCTDYPKELCEVVCEEPCFPPAGMDIMDSTLLHDIDIPGFRPLSCESQGTCQGQSLGSLYRSGYRADVHQYGNGRARSSRNGSGLRANPHYFGSLPKSRSAKSRRRSPVLASRPTPGSWSS